MSLFSFLTSTIFVLSSASQAVAAPNDLQAVHVQPYQAEASQLCPSNVKCIQDGTIVKLEFTIGCVDRYGQFDHKIVGRDHIVISQTSIKDKQSEVVRCKTANWKTVQLILRNVYPPFEIEMMGTRQVLKIDNYNMTTAPR